MAKQIRDDEDNLKRRARRRLIGAVALVTIVVVLLPMVLDNEPKPVGKDIELRIPDKDKAGEFVSKIDAPVVSAPVAVSSVAASSVASAPPAASHEAAVSAVPAVPEIKPQPAPEKSAAVEHKPASKPETKPAEHHAEPQQHASPEGFIVQIGAFSNADTAHRWHKNLVNQNIKAYTEKAGDKVRVRVGPFATREAAEKLRHRLESQGLRPAIIPAQ